MGHPYEIGYRDREKQYLQCEQQIMEELLRAPEISSEDNCVVDTTGSVIHCALDEQERLCELGLVVYLKADEETRSHLMQCFLLEPKPLIWGDIYELVRTNRGGDLPPDTLLQEAFIELFYSREKKYEGLADVVINASDVKAQCATASDLLLMIETAKIEAERR
jgi:shikimate kinase